MKLIFGNGSNILRLQRQAVVTIGNFDGVHLGHQHLLQLVIKKAQQHKLLAVVVIFEPQTNEFFSTTASRLSSLREKLVIMQSYAIDYVYCLRFNQDLANMAAEDFIEQIIIKQFNTKLLILGRDFRFGKNKQGDVDLLTTQLQDIAKILIAPDKMLNQQRISSTLVRQALITADFLRSTALLGRKFSICSRVIKGAGNGTLWGIPTINLNLRRKNFPIRGVFCVQVRIIDTNELVCGVANFGTRPTVDGTQEQLEIHLFDFNGILYGKMLEVVFLHKLRAEQKFIAVTSLIAQIRCDIQDAKNYFLNTNRVNINE